MKQTVDFSHLKIKISKRTRERFLFYAAQNTEHLNKDLLCFELTGIVDFQDGRTALECYQYMESTGKKLPCCEAELLGRVLHSKTMWGVSISNWVRSIEEGTLLIWELRTYLEELPEWIKRETMGLLQKKTGWRAKFTL